MVGATPVAHVKRKVLPDIDLVNLQQADPSLTELMQQTEPEGWKVWKNPDELLLALKKSDEEAPVGSLQGSGGGDPDGTQPRTPGDQ